MSNYNAMFIPKSGFVRKLDHVTVECKVSNDQVTYNKIFLPDGWNYWAQHENKILGSLNSLGLKYVVQLSVAIFHADGNVKSVETHNAGLTIDEWLKVAPKYTDGTTLTHPFQKGEDFLRLMRAVLVALSELHDHGIVHCDVKQDNICIPFEPNLYQKNVALKPDFSKLKLIDFSFSFGKNHPITQKLLVEPTADYQSPLYKKALSLNLENNSPKYINELSNCIDLYSLGFMGRQIMNGTRFLWESEARGSAGRLLAEQLIDDLLSWGAGTPSFRYWIVLGKPHDRMIKKLDMWLKNAPEQASFIPVAPASNSVSLYTPQPTPVLATPIATPIATPFLSTINPFTDTPPHNDPLNKTLPAKYGNLRQWMSGGSVVIILFFGVQQWLNKNSQSDAPGNTADSAEPAAIGTTKTIAAKALADSQLNDDFNKASKAAADAKVASDAKLAADAKAVASAKAAAAAAAAIAKGKADIEEKLSQAKQLADSRDPARLAQAFKLYTELANDAAGTNQRGLDASRDKVFYKLKQSSNTPALAKVKGSSALLAALKISAARDPGYYYYLGLYSACNASPPNFEAARSAYQMALKDPNMQPHAQAALEKGGKLCP